MGNFEWEYVFDDTLLEFVGIDLVNATNIHTRAVVEFDEDGFVGESGERCEITVQEDTPNPHAEGVETLLARVYIEGQLVQTLEIVDTNGSGIIYVEWTGNE